MILHREVQRGR